MASPGRSPLLVVRPGNTSTADVDRTQAIAPVAAVPAVLLAVVQLGPLHAGLTLAGFVVVNLVMGNMIEPRWMGRGLNLSPLVVFVSLVLWGWVLGPVGMLLSIPLTIMIKIALESQDETRWISIMLGAADSPTQDER